MLQPMPRANAPHVARDGRKDQIGIIHHRNDPRRQTAATIRVVRKKQHRETLGLAEGHPALVCRFDLVHRARSKPIVQDLVHPFNEGRRQSIKHGSPRIRHRHLLHQRPSDTVGTGRVLERRHVRQKGRRRGPEHRVLLSARGHRAVGDHHLAQLSAQMLMIRQRGHTPRFWMTLKHSPRLQERP